MESKDDTIRRLTAELSDCEAEIRSMQRRLSNQTREIAALRASIRSRADAYAKGFQDGREAVKEAILSALEDPEDSMPPSDSQEPR